MKEVVPENARDVLASREEEAANILIRLPIDWSGDEEVLDYWSSG